MKNIPGFEKYTITQKGVVFSLENGHGLRKKPLRRKTYFDRAGYERIVLCKERRYDLSIARLVATTFLREPSDSETVNHKDGIKHNNNLVNLEWLSQSDNNLHRSAMGLIKHKQHDKHIYKSGNCWVVIIARYKKRHYLGRFKDKLEARQVRNNFLKSYAKN